MTGILIEKLNNVIFFLDFVSKNIKNQNTEKIFAIEQLRDILTNYSESISLKETIEKILELGIKENLKKTIGEENKGRTVEAMLLMKYFKVFFSSFITQNNDNFI